MKLLPLLLPALVSVATLQAQHSPNQSSPNRTPPHPRPDSPSTLTATSLKVDGLEYAREIDRIYWGDFEHVHLDRSGLEFGTMMSSYMQDYGVACAAFLPKNNVEIMAQECTQESYWVNGYGFEKPGSRTCTHYRTYGTGVYADPELFNATNFEGGKMATAMLRNLGSIMSKTGDAGINAAMGNLMQTMDFTRQASDFKSDINQLLRNNTCAGEPLKRFQKNLIAYATGVPSIRMAGIPDAPPFRDSDYQTLLDDLVSKQASGWLLNRFTSNSVSNVVVRNRDAAGTPLSITANYAYQGMQGKLEGKVELRFDDGAPHCLVFSDVPDACRAISHTLAAAYEDGKYVTDHPAVARTYVAPDLRQVEVVADRAQPVLVEVPGKALDMPQGRVFPTRGKLLQDVKGFGPGGASVVLAHAGSQVYLSVFNSQRGVQFYLARVGDDPNQLISMAGSQRQFRAGVDSLPHDGSPLQVSFDVPPNVKSKMLLADFERQKAALVATASSALAPNQPVPDQPTPSRTLAGDNSRLLRHPDPLTQPRKFLPTGTLLQLRFADPITVDQVSQGKLFSATLVATRSAVFQPAAHAESLPEGTVVFVSITPGNGNQFLIQADHAVLRGANIPLQTNVQARIPIRSSARNAPVQVRVWGTGRLPALPQTAQSMLLIQPATVLHLITKIDAPLEALPQ